MGDTTSGAIQSIAMLGNYAPRRCGIATFTTDRSEALAAASTSAACSVIAMNEPGTRYVHQRGISAKMIWDERQRAKTGDALLSSTGVRSCPAKQP